MLGIIYITKRFEGGRSDGTPGYTLAMEEFASASIWEKEKTIMTEKKMCARKLLRLTAQYENLFRDWSVTTHSKNLISQLPILAAMKLSIVYSLAFLTIPDAGSICLNMLCLKC